jgi:hypothetical protein
MDKKYVKMADLVDNEFTVESVGLAKYVAWDNDNKRFLTEDNWFKGASKKYPITTNLGTVDMSATNVGNMFEGVQHAGQSNIVGATFNVKSNGKTGMEIRYFINPVKSSSQQSGYDKARAQADELRPTQPLNKDIPITNDFSDYEGF